MSDRSLRLVAVSQRVDVLPDRDETQDSLDQHMPAWLARAGCAAVPVPNMLEDGPSSSIPVNAWLDMVDPALVVLSGGNDIGSVPRRDATEATLLMWAERRKRPVLGICRGMQMMGVQAGGAMVRVDGHVRTHHDLGGDWPGRVNSFHEFGFTHCPPGYDVLSRADDDTIEAMRHKTLPWEGWMWHPERGEPRTPDLHQLLQILNHDQ